MLVIIAYIVFIAIAFFVYRLISDRYRIRYVIFMLLSGLLLGPLFSIILLLLYLLMKFLPNKLIVIMILCSATTFVCFRALRGYYPVPYSVRYLSYLIYDDIFELHTIILDEDFKLSEPGYILSTSFSSHYAVEHVLLIELKDVRFPVDYNYKCKIKIEIYRDKKLVYSAIKGELSKSYIYENGKPAYTAGFTLDQTPFPLDKKSYKNLQIIVEIIEVDNKLENSNQGYYARLLLSPYLPI